MDRPRLALALFLSFTVIIAWQYFFAPPPPPAEPGAGPTATAPAPPASPAAGGSQSPAAPPVADTLPAPVQPVQVAEQDITVETKFWKAVLSNRGGVLKQWVLKQLPGGKLLKDSKYAELNLVSQYAISHSGTGQGTELGAPLQLTVPAEPALDRALNTSLYSVNVPDTSIRLGAGEKKELIFTYQDPAKGITIQKKFAFQNEERDSRGYLFEFSVEARRGADVLPVSTILGPNFGDQSVTEFDSYTHTPQQAVVYAGSPTYLGAADIKPDAPKTLTNATWTALTDHYFAMAFIPPQPATQVVLANRKATETVKGKATEHDYAAVKVTLANGAVNSIYIGPKDRNYLLPINDHFQKRVDLEPLVNYGFFAFLVRPLIPILDVSVKLLYHYTHNYGWAIIIITIIVNTLLFPLKWKSSVALKKSAKIQPKIKELQDKMNKLKSDDPRKLELQMEMFQLTKEANPLKGCLPLLIQLPIFWAFFLYLQLSVDIRQSPFISWLTDLSAPDHLHILPIAFCLTQMGSTLLMPSPTSDDPAQKMNRMMMTWILPIVLTYFFFWSAPSGLVLYWMAGNLIGISQQLVINKLNPPDPPDQVPATNDGDSKKKQRKSASDLVVNES
ncbi:MAG: membrane protein insertase YidC [Blastocatellia bacterium]|nr:membrane protein insertase YidC [Blastocatellia bacterium]